MRLVVFRRMTNDFHAPQICLPVRRWYGSTKSDGEFGWASRLGRTIGTERFSRETGGAIHRTIAEESNPRRALSRVETYETQDHHPFCSDRPDAGFFQACRSAKPLYRSIHGWPVLRPQSLQSPPLSGSGIVGWRNWPDLFGDFHQQSSREPCERHLDPYRAAAGNRKR